MGTPVQAKLNILGVTGSINLTTAWAFTWSITAQVEFRASAAGVTLANCITPSFSISISGDYHGSGGIATSTPFTIPALSGSGTGACNGHATNINGDLLLGSAGATLQITKWEGINILSGQPLDGS